MSTIHRSPYVFVGEKRSYIGASDWCVHKNARYSSRLSGFSFSSGTVSDIFLSRRAELLVIDFGWWKCTLSRRRLRQWRSFHVLLRWWWRKSGHRSREEVFFSSIGCFLCLEIPSLARRGLSWWAGKSALTESERGNEWRRFSFTFSFLASLISY